VAKCVENRTVGSRLPGEDENFVTIAFQSKSGPRAAPMELILDCETFNSQTKCLLNGHAQRRN
jgi:hypothetical protein